MTAPEQITFDGELVPYPPPSPRRLTQRQRDLVLYVRCWRTVTITDVRRFYADPHGALRRLETFGLVKRAGRGEWTT